MDECWWESVTMVEGWRVLEGSVKTRKVHVATPELNTCLVNTDAQGTPGCMMANHSPSSTTTTLNASGKAREQPSANPFMKKGSPQQRHQGRCLSIFKELSYKEDFCCQTSRNEDLLNQLRTYFDPPCSTSLCSLSNPQGIELRVPAIP